jgi:hypothetical protein
MLFPPPRCARGFSVFTTATSSTPTPACFASVTRQPRIFPDSCFWPVASSTNGLKSLSVPGASCCTLYFGSSSRTHFPPSRCSFSAAACTNKTRKHIIHTLYKEEVDVEVAVGVEAEVAVAAHLKLLREVHVVLRGGDHILREHEV